MRAVAYARYSTDKQTENSIDTQLNAINDYCAANSITIISTFVDMAMSGTNTERPDFQRMLAGAKSKQFEAVIIYDISRASRDLADWLNFRKLMQSYNIKVISTTQNLGSIDNPDTFLTETITAALGQHMVLQTRQKSIAGTAEKAKQGVFLGGYAPLGYDIVDGKYIVNDHEAKAVRTIFSMYAMGDSYADIFAKLAEGGYKGRRGATIGKTGLHAILKQERYIGTYTWNKHKMKYFGKWAGGEKNPNAVRIENAIPAIIDYDTWERVQKRMNNNKRNASNTAKHEYLLSGLVECGKCGASFTGRASTNKKGYTTRYYVCGSKNRAKTCDAKNINADQLESAVVIKLKEYFANGDFDTMADEIFKAYTNGKGSKVEEKKELKEVERQLANGTKAILDGVDITELKEEMARLNVRKSELQDIIAVSPDLILTKEMIAEKLKKDAQLLHDGEVKRLIKSYVTKIYTHSDEIIITGGVNMEHCGRRI
ncbi:MAG: recombinase family protein [Oscillospiraceae bacterium]|nr:recombinase family protein [Oscillospiraceae bacterium]